MIECELVEALCPKGERVLGRCHFPVLPVLDQKVFKDERVFDVIACAWAVKGIEIQSGDLTGVWEKRQNIAVYRVTLQDENFGTVREKEAA